MVFFVMRKIYFLIFKTFVFCLQAQLAQYGAEIYSKASYKYGKFETVLTPSDKSRYITSFYLYTDQGKGASLNFELSKDGSVCYLVDQQYYRVDSLKPSPTASLTIEWTPIAVKYFMDTQLVMEVPLNETQLTQAMKVGFTIWKRHDARELLKADTSLSELDSFKYHAYTPNGFEEKHTDNFDQLDTKFWTKSTAKYADNVLQNDTNMLFVDKGKLQMIGLSYKIKNYKRLFKRDRWQAPSPYITNAAYKASPDEPCIVLTYSDTIYSPDKNVKNFKIEDIKITKSKLKADYKTVVLYLEKPIDKPINLLYFPTRARFRKPQVVKLP